MLHAFAPALIAAALLMTAGARASAQTSPHGRTTPPQSPARDDEALRSLRVFDAKGAPVTLEQLVEALGAADAVFVGEQHNDAGAHTLEAELLRRAFLRYARGDGEEGRRQIVLSLEFFERDVQTVLDEYLAGLISERHFLASSRPWKNYEKDYRPLVEFARAHKIPVVAANAPARYVSRVTQNGPASLAALPEESRRWLPPLPVAPASSRYAEKFNAFLRGEAAVAAAMPAGGQVGGVASPHAQTSPHGGPALHLLDAQNLRDASMGHAVAESLRRWKRALVLHYNGAFHSEGRLGVPEQVARYRKGARLLVVTAVPASTYDAARMSGLGDYVVLTRRAP